MIRRHLARVTIIALALLLTGSAASVARNALADRNIFADKGLIHILGPSPAISPSTDPSAVDSFVLESCDVLKDFDTYYWYYHAKSRDRKRWPGAYRICAATAPTPLGPWTKYANNPVVDHGPPGSWDEDSVDGGVVLKQGAYDVKAGSEVYYMWYAGGGPKGRGIGLATAASPLGPWKKFEGNPVVRNFGYLGGVVRKDGKFYMFVQNPVGHGTDQGPFQMAVADRPEGPWTKYDGNPVMTPGDWGDWDDGGYSESRVRYHEGIFHCFYGGTKTPKLESIGYAYSFDGIDWHKYAANPVVPLSSVPDAAGLAEVHSLIEGSYIYLYHTLRYFTGEGTERGLSSYPPVGATGRRASEALASSAGRDFDLRSMKWRTEDLGIQILTMDSHFKVAFPVLTLDTLGPQQSSRWQSCVPIGLEHASTLAITVECAYHPRAQAGIRVHVRASADGVHGDTVDLHAGDLTLRAGAMVRETWQWPLAAKYARVIVENLDRIHPVKSVKVVATVGN